MEKLYVAVVYDGQRHLNSLSNADSSDVLRCFFIHSLYNLSNLSEKEDLEVKNFFSNVHIVLFGRKNISKG